MLEPSNVVAFQARRPRLDGAGTWSKRIAGWQDADPLIRVAAEILDDEADALEARVRAMVHSGDALLLDILAEHFDAAADEFSVVVEALRLARDRLRARLASVRVVPR